MSVPMVHDNLHADVSVHVGEMQNTLTSAEKSKTAAATDWISIPGLKLEIRMFFQNALNLLKRKLSGGRPHCNAEFLFKQNFMNMMSAIHIENSFLELHFDQHASTILSSCVA